ncbi:MAG: DUF2256 domain-containing protein [Lysobacterales bacterium]|nr:DUF2256 domain-containing protein [Xanthomonadales bacterium]MCB1611161.1 DUF2256 domain-containing protein [Xanthomonadales bacterium]MCP5475301.1 DUF2256 domain-containing protein [Rhodanobacteraceae bacterium]
MAAKTRESRATPRASKLCAHCQRPMTWRKRWEKVWEQVKYCSDACRLLAKRQPRAE